jgi:sugar O-acyltransferase (sialic acid O-acetyltransferase NeuD family)
MKRLIIIGGRNLGRELLSLSKQCEGFGKDWMPYGFLDDDKSLEKKNNLPLPIISSVEAYSPTNDDVFICALGNPWYKKKYITEMVAKGAQFISLVHPTAIIHDNVDIGHGVIIQPNCLISDHVVLADFVTVQAYSTLGHDTSVKAYSHVSAYSFTGGGVVLEEGVLTGTRSTILPNIKVNQFSVVGACSLATKNVPPFTTVFGVPAVAIASNAEQMSK